MIVPAWTEFHLVKTDDGAEWRWGPSPAGVCVVRVHLDGRAETRAASPSGQPYLEKLLERHPFDASTVRAFVVRVHGRPHAIVQARSKFEAARHAGVPPEGLEVRAREECSPEEWAALVAAR